jgi:hypothetical protein
VQRSADEHAAERVHQQRGLGTITQRADALERRAVARAGLEHEPLILGSATCGKRRVVRGAPTAAALRTGGLGGRVAAVAVRRRHAKNLPD